MLSRPERKSKMEQRPEYHLNLAVLLLVALADDTPRHAYLLIDELVDLTGWKPSPSSVSDALGRLERDQFIEPVPAKGRQKPFRITEAGREELDSALALLHRLTRVGRSRIKQWREENGRTGDIPSSKRSRSSAPAEQASPEDPPDTAAGSGTSR